MAKLNIIGNALSTEDEIEVIKRYYAAWRDTNSNSNAIFVALFKKGFLENYLLRDLSTGALRLYIYFGLYANNNDGGSWPSIKTIATYFDKSERQVNTWIKELQDKNLIHRTKDGKKSSTTYLIPYTDTIIDQRLKSVHLQEKSDVLDNLLSVIKKQESVYGKVISVSHIYKWEHTSKKKLSHKSKNLQFIFVVTKREDGVCTGHRYPLHKITKVINQLRLKEIATFESDLIYKNEPVKGMAIRHDSTIKEPDGYKEWLTIMDALVKGLDNPEIILQHPTVEYGELNDLWDDEEEPIDGEEQEN